MLMRSQVIDNAPAFLAVNHVSVKTAGMAGFEITDPRDRLSPERVKIRIVPDGEGDIGPIFGEHNSPPASHVKKGQRKELATPHLLHNTFADRPSLVFTAESKAFLDSRMQELEFIPQRSFVDGSHAVFSGARRQCAAVERSRLATIAM